MSDILDRIIAVKRREVAAAKALISRATLDTSIASCRLAAVA